MGVPAEIGRWKVIRKLGHGGMGAVYLGHHGADTAAIKLVSPTLASDEHFRARFRREVEICRRVAGPQVAELLEADVSADRPWLAIQFIDGQTLDQAVSNSGPISGDDLHDFAFATTEALRQIHAAGVVHRDLKPSNIIVTPTSTVVIDFGIAAATEAASLTMTGMLMGSAGWMAPEQLTGCPVGPAADVFAWGANLAFASTGHSPFGTGRPEAVAYRVVHEAPDLSTVPDEIFDVVSAALARHPENRPSIHQLQSRLSGGTGISFVGATSVSSAVRPTPISIVSTHPITQISSPALRPEQWAPPIAKLIVVAALIAAAATLGGTVLGRTVLASDAATTETSPSEEELLGTNVSKDPSLSSPISLPTTPNLTGPRSATTLPYLEMTITPLTADGDHFGKFSIDHFHEVVELDVQFLQAEDVDLGDLVEVQPFGTTAHIFVCSEKAEDFCRGTEILLEGLPYSDGSLTAEDDAFRLRGQFVIKAVESPELGSTLVQLHAAPTPGS